MRPLLRWFARHAKWPMALAITFMETTCLWGLALVVLYPYEGRSASAAEVFMAVLVTFSAVSAVNALAMAFAPET